MSNKKQPARKVRGAMVDVLWMGFHKTGAALPWIWGSTRATCVDRQTPPTWEPHEYIRSKVKIVPLPPNRRAK